MSVRIFFLLMIGCMAMTTSFLFARPDKQIPGLEEFTRFLQHFITVSPCNKKPYHVLAARTKNTGAQVCGTTSRKWNAIGCHPNNNTAIFPTNSHGFAAHVDLLRRFCATQNRCTIARLFGNLGRNSYHQGNFAQYINFVALRSGFHPNMVFNPNDANTMGRIAAASACYEAGGFPWEVEEIRRGLAMAFGGDPVPMPNNIGEILRESLTGPIDNSSSPFFNPNSPHTFNPPTAQLSQGDFNQPNPPQDIGDNDVRNPNIPRPLSPILDSPLNFKKPKIKVVSDRDDSGRVEKMKFYCDGYTLAWKCGETADYIRLFSFPQDRKFQKLKSLKGVYRPNITKQTVYMIRCMNGKVILDERICVLRPKKINDFYGD